MKSVDIIDVQPESPKYVFRDKRYRGLRLDVRCVGSENVELFGYRISTAGLEGDTAKALSWVKSRNASRYMATANPHSLVTASNDVVFKSALREADILIPDGTGILLASRLLSTSPVITEKVAGTDFFLRFTEIASQKGGLRYYFLGASEHVLSMIRTRIEMEYPSIDVCGTYSPPFCEKFEDAENQRMLEAVEIARPDVLWVGMTAPKQEKWIFENRSKLDVPFIGAIGAVFDFYAGTKVRSSVFWQKLGLEWLPRFFREPRRLWERNLKSTPVFLGWILREKLRRVFSSR